MVRKFKAVGKNPAKPKEGIVINVEITVQNDRGSINKQTEEIKDKINDVLREYYYQSQITIK